MPSNKYYVYLFIDKAHSKTGYFNDQTMIKHKDKEHSILLGSNRNPLKVKVISKTRHIKHSIFSTKQSNLGIIIFYTPFQIIIKNNIWFGTY